MPRAPAARSLAPDLPFKYVGGDPAVDLVNTVDWTPNGPVDDRLTSYERLTRWAEGGEVVSPRLGEALRARATVHPRQAERALDEAIDLRWTLRRIFAAIAHGSAPPTEAVAELNGLVHRAMGRLQLAPEARSEGGILRWTWVEAGEHLDSMLWPVARSAALLLVSDEAARIRECGGADCGWQYVDRSRNGRRRWCQMEVCGTREKSRRRAARRLAPARGVNPTGPGPLHAPRGRVVTLHFSTADRVLGRLEDDMESAHSRYGDSW
jgi:predicted RNA-binding Zn ribbon-like protein